MAAKKKAAKKKTPLMQYGEDRKKMALDRLKKRQGSKPSDRTSKEKAAYLKKRQGSLPSGRTKKR